MKKKTKNIFRQTENTFLPKKHNQQLFIYFMSCKWVNFSWPASFTYTISESVLIQPNLTDEDFNLSAFYTAWIWIDSNHQFHETYFAQSQIISPSLHYIRVLEKRKKKYLWSSNKNHHYISSVWKVCYHQWKQ